MLINDDDRMAGEIPFSRMKNFGICAEVESGTVCGEVEELKLKGVV